jgi:hypothetical protein
MGLLSIISRSRPQSRGPFVNSSQTTPQRLHRANLVWEVGFIDPTYTDAKGQAVLIAVGRRGTLSAGGVTRPGPPTHALRLALAWRWGSHDLPYAARPAPECRVLLGVPDLPPRLCPA